ncbi:hypothetical protein BJX99DRAFT_232686 [Aspergillus californicus]
MEALPGGLVSTSGKVSAELGVIDAVDIGDIVQLWKAYSTNPSVHAGDTGYRLQNFFWRIWGNERLSNTLTGSILARLFLQISEPSSLTLVKAKIKVRDNTESEPPSSSLKHEKPSPGHGTGHPSSGGTAKSPLPPILKKKSNSSSHGEGQTQKTTRLLLTGLSGESVTRKPSNPPTPIPPSQPVAILEQATRQSGIQGQSSKKTFVVASKAKAKSAKRRPVLMRRKSSQQSSIPSTRAHSPQSVPVSPSGNRAPELPVSAPIPVVHENEKEDTNEEAVEDDDEEPPEGPATASISTLSTTMTTATTERVAETAATTPTPTFSFSFMDALPNAHTDAEAEVDTELPPTPILTAPHYIPYTPRYPDDNDDKKQTPLPPLRPRNPTPLVGFFSSTSCRNFDIRNLYADNYGVEQPTDTNLVNSDFRGKFAEQVKLAEEWQVRMEMEEPGHNAGAGDVLSEPAIGNGTDTFETGSAPAPVLIPITQTGSETEAQTQTGPGVGTVETGPSLIHGAIPTIATSTSLIDSEATEPFSPVEAVVDRAPSVVPSSGAGPGGPAEATVSLTMSHAVTAPMPVPVPPQGSIAGGVPNSTFLQSPPALSSLPRGPSQLSVMIEHSRSVGSFDEGIPKPNA